MLHERATVLYGKGKQLRSKLETVARDGISNLHVIMDFNLALTADDQQEEHQEAIGGPREEGKESGASDEEEGQGPAGRHGRTCRIREDVKDLIVTLKEKKIPIVFYSTGHYRTLEEMAGKRLKEGDLSSLMNLVTFQPEGEGDNSISLPVTEVNAIMHRQNVFVVGDEKSTEKIAAAMKEAKCLVKLAFLHGDDRHLDVYVDRFDLLAFGDMSLQPINSLFCKLFGVKMSQGA
eukprot:368846-Hanusia_phi.AAC.9